MKGLTKTFIVFMLSMLAMSILGACTATPAPVVDCPDWVDGEQCSMRNHQRNVNGNNGQIIVTSSDEHQGKLVLNSGALMLMSTEDILVTDAEGNIITGDFVLVSDVEYFITGLSPDAKFIIKNPYRYRASFNWKIVRVVD